MSTDDKSNGYITRDEESEIYNELENDVQEITLEYTKTFLDIDRTSDPKDIKRNLVSMEAFISYFDTGILRYVEQTVNLIRILYNPFDSELEKLTGLRVEDYIAFYQLICDEFQDAMDSSIYAINNLKDFLNSFNPYAVDVEKEFERLMTFTQGPARNNFQNAMDGLNSIKASKIQEKFGKEKGEKLLAIFGLYRKARDFLYYNGKNPFAEHPLCWIDEGETLFIVHPQFDIVKIS